MWAALTDVWANRTFLLSSSECLCRRRVPRPCQLRDRLERNVQAEDVHREGQQLRPVVRLAEWKGKGWWRAGWHDGAALAMSSARPEPAMAPLRLCSDTANACARCKNGHIKDGTTGICRPRTCQGAPGPCCSVSHSA